MKRMVVRVISSFLLSIVLPAAQLGAQNNAVALEKAAPTAGNSSETTLASIEVGKARDSELRIASGDLLEISLFETDFACGPVKTGCEVRVSSSGDIVLPLIGAMRVAGLTVAQAEQVIAAGFSEGRFFNNPQVTVVQKEYASQGISVLGEVQKPGTYPLIGSHMLLQAISAAGGTTAKAGNDVMVIRSDSPNQPQHVDVSSLTGGSTPLMPGDTVVVSKAGIVYIVGDVRQPSGIAMERSGLTILKAIAMAQGTNPTASLKNAKLIRNTPQGKQEVHISIKEILSNKAPDVELQPEDILFIPNSLAKSATRRSLEAILQTATGVAIYARY
jgi:polysaccharide biosynthesis/export protein